jgi:hypothetical protein
LPSSLGTEFTLGDNPWAEPGISRTSSSAIARVRIYDRALSAQHIAAHFAGDYNTIVPISANSTHLDYSIDSTARSVQATVDNPADAATGVAPQVKFAVSSVDAPAPLVESAGHGFVDGQATAILQLGTLKAGDYELSATIASGGTVLARLVKPLTIPSLEWEGTHVGAESKVLPPWTPLQVQRGVAPSVACWGRAYQFGNAAFPVQINSRDRDLLARPIELNVVAGGHALAWTGGSAVVTAASDVAAEIDGSARAQTSAGLVDLKTHFHIEYDGLMLVDIALEPPPALKIESMSLEIPLRGEVALLRHRWTNGWGGGSDALAPGDGVLDSAAFIPYAWLGDNDRGLFWFCESGRDWPNFESQQAIETVRAGDTVALRLNLLAPGQALPVHWSYRCGLQATPVKPLPAHWRKWRLAPAPRANVAIIWPSPNKTMKYFGYPEAADPDAFAKRVQALHAQGLKAVPYSCLTYLSAASPEWKWFGDQWRRGTDSDAAFPSDVAAYGAPFEPISPVPQSWRDFITWKNQQFMDRFGLDGFYHDNSSPYALALDKPGGGWKDATGHMHPVYPILAYRDLYRRIYAMVKARQPDSFLIAHMSGTLAIPILAYEDAYLDGENFRGKVQDSYLDVMSLGYFRAEMMGRQWGLIPIFLTEFAGDNIKRAEPARGLMALLMVHDVPVWAVPWSCNLKPVADAYDALDAFGYADAEFIPYFDPNPPAVTAMKDVYISVYKRADGCALAIVANLSREDRSGSIHFDAGRIGLPLDSVMSWPDKGAVKRDGDTVDLDVPGLGYRMLLIGKLPDSNNSP